MSRDASGADEELIDCLRDAHHDLGEARAERDEARAIARRLAATVRAEHPVTGSRGCEDCALIQEFDALPWAKDAL